MKEPAANKFTHSHVVLEDGTVAFKCSADQDIWPWLALHPFDPIVVQTVNYWASVETSTARGTWDPTKWSALTQSDWTCGKSGANHPTHGVADLIKEGENLRFQLTFFDKYGSLVYRMSGIGVVFQNRDFESWRDKAKQQITAPVMAEDFQYAPANLVGVGSQNESFLSPLIDHHNPSAQALITKENGFPPEHPFLSGSGDHVNSTHLADVARQFLNLVLDGRPRLIIGGEMIFKRYVELGLPFHIALTQEDRSQNTISMAVQQSDHLCATITLKYSHEQ
ncbi:hypothetical protein GCM10009096_20380 [Parasphingorhabdus litoris]|uniref:Dihydrofolate reductase n=1 Tax=Parasphingorhabdus litoris TaxID=394733 RepID=A0ABN1AJY3_9SPHN|nr:hypothetical protein [Parasphingorhabdus litoris]